MKKLVKKRWLKKLFKKRKGFSLHEIITVLVIIGILITASVVYAGNIVIGMRDTQRLNDISEFQMALQMYKQDNGVYPDSLPAGQPLVGPSGKVYLNTVPTNPTPHTDGDCLDEGYNYSVNEDGSYVIGYCLGRKKDKVPPGQNYATPSGMVCRCEPGFTCATGKCEIMFAENWTEQIASGVKPYRGGLACNQDCSKIAAASQEQGIYLSSDYGKTWVQKGTWSWQYSAIAGSADLKKMAVAVKVGKVYDRGVWTFMNYIHTSDDYGMTWTPRTTSGLRYWGSVASSADGVKLAAAVRTNGYIYTSPDSGATWVERTSAGLTNWDDITSSADGNTLLAVDYAYGLPGYIHVSYDSGETWTTKTEVGQKSWVAVAMSANAKKMYAVANSDFIYASTDSGQTWAKLNNSYSRIWWDISTSNDGKKVVATAHGGPTGTMDYIYTSKDSGLSWTVATTPGKDFWNHAIVSPDGNRIVAARDQDYIYTSP